MDKRVWAVATAIGVCQAAWAIDYTVLEVPMPAGHVSAAAAESRALNNSGQVLMYTGPNHVSISSTPITTVRYTPGQSLLEYNPENAGNAFGHYLNDAGAFFGRRGRGGGSARFWRYNPNDTVTTFPAGSVMADNFLALTMNNSGVVIGSYFDETANPPRIALRLNADGTYEPLSTLSPLLADAHARDLADSGWFCATRIEPGSINYSIVYSPGSGAVNVGTLGRPFVALTSISEDGLAAGVARTALQPLQIGVIYDTAGGLRIVPGLENMPEGHAIVSSNGIVAGSYLSPSLEGFIFRYTVQGGMVSYSLAPLAPAAFPVARNAAFSVNTAGQVLGSTSFGTDDPRDEPGASMVWIWSPANGLRDLQQIVDPGATTWQDLSPYGLNDSGQILLYARHIPSGHSRLLLLTPICGADFNGSGSVSVQDIFDFLAAFFADDARADFNDSGAIGVQDIFDYLAAYFLGCS
jgi:hypothetical protein